MSSALLVVDIQNDFLSGGLLAIESANNILPTVHKLLAKPWSIVIASQDSHPQNHISFAANHTDALPFTTVGSQDVWPVHCVIGTEGEKLEKSLVEGLKKVHAPVEIIRKGFEVDRDVYSAFNGEFEKDGKSKITNLLQVAAVKNVVVVGLATDYCLRASTLSAISESAGQWKVYVVNEAIAGVDKKASNDAIEEMKQAGATFIDFDQVDGILV